MLTPLLLITLGLTDAAAAAPTTVRLVLDRPLDMIFAAPADGSPVVALPDGPLPSGEEFLLTVALSAGVSATAKLDVWPAQGKPCAATPPVDGRQRHTVGMTQDGAQLSGRVPPLQVGQTYCLSLEPRMTLGEEGMARLADQAAEELTLRLPYEFTCDSDSALPHFKTALSKGLTAAGFDGAGQKSVDAAAEEALARYRAGAGPAACANVMASEDKAKTLEGILNGAKPPTGAERTAVDQDLLTALQDRQKNAATLDAALTAALNATSVRQRIVVAVGSVHVGAQPATAATRDKVNFVVPAAGASVAWWPDQSPALVGWGGVSFYSTPVDRYVPLNELVGSSSDLLRQRLSLTVGLARMTPTLPGYTTSPALGTLSPLITGGYRLTHYAQITAGAVFVRVDDPNPASAASSIQAAPVVGLSVDFALQSVISALPSL